MAGYLLRNQLLQIGSRPAKAHFSRQFSLSFCWYSDSINSASFPSTTPLSGPEAEKEIKSRETAASKSRTPVSPPSNSEYDDAKLRQIIETSNMSAARQVERQRQKQQEFQIQKEREEAESRGKSEKITERAINVGPAAVENGDTSRRIDVSSPSVDNSEAAGSLKTQSQPEIPPPVKAGPSSNSPNTAKPVTLQSIHKDLQEKAQQQRLKLEKWMEERWKHAQNSLKVVAQSLNDATGYSGIEKHKLLVERVEHEIKEARNAVKMAKTNYEEAIQQRSDSQKEINELLTRKHTWTPEDVERFTELYKNDHQNEHDEIASKQALDEAEQHVETVQIKLTSSILTRYHEEQLWSDKIRQASTWGTWMLMGVNIALFATATFFVEPWKRRKLVNAFQAEVQQKLEEYSTELKSLSQRISPISPISPSSSEAVANGELSTLSQSSSSAENHHVSFFGLDSWNSLREWAASLAASVKADNVNFTMAKPDLAVFSGILVALGWLFGSLVNFVIFRK